MGQAFNENGCILRLVCINGEVLLLDCLRQIKVVLVTEILGIMRMVWVYWFLVLILVKKLVSGFDDTGSCCHRMMKMKVIEIHGIRIINFGG